LTTTGCFSARKTAQVFSRSTKQSATTARALADDVSLAPRSRSTPEGDKRRQFVEAQRGHNRLELRAGEARIFAGVSIMAMSQYGFGQESARFCAAIYARVSSAHRNPSSIFASNTERT
jgi:hypothetical protein